MINQWKIQFYLTLTNIVVLVATIKEQFMTKGKPYVKCDLNIFFIGNFDSDNFFQNLQ